MEREAVLDSRPPKPCPGDHVDLREEWFERVDGLGYDPEGVVGEALGGVPRPGSLTPEAPLAMAGSALAALPASPSTWRPHQLPRELPRAVPTPVPERSDHPRTQ